MAADVTKAIKFLLLGDDKSAVSALRRVSGEMKNTAKSGASFKGVGKDMLQAIRSGQGFKGVSGVLKNAAAEAGGLKGVVGKVGVGLAAAGAAGIAAGAAIALKFGKDSIDTFKRVAGEVAKLKRVTGLSTEDASRMAFAFKQTGVDAEKGTKGLQLLSKNLSGAADGGKKAAAMTKLLGFGFTDASGKVLPMSKLMPKLADKFSSMPDGAGKTALAMKLFGKSGTDLLPFLNKGAKGLDDLAKKSDKFGNTLTDKQLQALKDSKQAQRDWDAAMQGLQVTLGSKLLPILTQWAVGINNALIPAIQGVTEWVAKNQASFDALGNLMRWVWNNVMLPLVKGAIWGFAAMNKPLAQAVQALGALTGNKDLETFGAGLVQAADDAMEFANSLKGIPDEVSPEVKANTEAAKKKVADVQTKIDGLKGKIVTAKAKGDDSELKKLERDLAKAEKKKWTLSVRARAISGGGWKITGNVSGAGDRYTLKAFRRGGINAYARGGMEDHGPKIYRPHDGPRLFNEPETRGESYIPLANDWRRPRAVAIWRQTGRELGVYAGGGIRGGRMVAASGPIKIDVSVNVPLGADRNAAAREVRSALVTLFNDTGLRVP